MCQSEQEWVKLKLEFLRLPVISERDLIFILSLLGAQGVLQSFVMNIQ
jgi:hypothetical protein